MLDWDKLRIFHSVAEAGSFTRAGDALNLSQSAISRQISSLERELAVPLFYRHARGLVLSEHGKHLFRATNEMRMRLDKTRAQLVETSELPAGLLKVNATVGLGSMWLARRVGEFLDQYPHVRIELILTNEELDVGMREADIAIRLRRPEQQDLIQRRLFTLHYCAFASRDYVKRFGEPQTVKDLENHRILCLGGHQPGFILAMHNLANLARDGDTPHQNVFVVNDSFALRRAIESGAGIGMAPAYAEESYENFVRVLKDVELPSLDAYLVYAAEMRSVARLQVFRDFLVQKAQNWSF
jgi:DNA-binding transcriptional LysR family regulator